MTDRDPLDSRLDAMIDIGTITSTDLGDGNVLIATLTGDAPADLDETTDHADDADVEQVTDVDVWGDPALLSRPAAPSTGSDAGSVEALFLRRGDTREVLGMIDRRWSIDPLEEGEAMLRFCGPIGGDGQPTIRPILHLHADGSIDLYADVVRIAKDDGTRLHVDRTNDAITGVAATTTLGKDASHKLEIDGDGDTLTAQAGSTKLALDGDADQADLVAATVNLTSATPTDAMALASKVNDRVDSIARALDALAGAIPVPNDGGTALQLPFKVLWGGSMPGVPTAPSNVGSTKIKGD